MVGTPQAINELLPSSAVLLLGSGFSLESKNIRDKAPPNGPALRKYFLDQLGLPPDTTYDLQVLAEEIASDPKVSLYREINSLFRIASVGTNQKEILREAWFRIYTTNYDYGVELCRHALNQQTNSYSSADPLPNRLPNNCVVHLHGSLRDLKEENVLSQLVLGESSYVRQYLEKSAWYTQFQADIKYTSHIFIIGYSLSDYHISALLLENPAIAERTFFVQGTTPNDVFTRRTANYGRTLFIGMDGFASALKTLPRTAPVVDVSRLKHFRLLDPLRDKKGLRAPTAIEILDLLIYGAFNYSRAVATLPNESYVISRATEIKSFLGAIGSSRSVILDSRIGNGKTIFMYLAFLALAELGYACFLFKAPGPSLDQELAALKPLGKLAIFFDEYTLA